MIFKNIPRAYNTVLRSPLSNSHFNLLRQFSSQIQHDKLLPKNIKTHLNETPVDSSVRIMGWVRSVRKQKKVNFIELNDGSTLESLQAIIEGTPLPNVTTGACLEIEGTLVNSPGSNQSKELLIENWKLIGSCDGEDYPLQKKRHTLEFIRNHAHLRARTKTNSSVLRVRNSIMQGLNDSFQSQDFIQVHPPIITSNDCEGGGEVFKVESNESVENPSGSGQENIGYFGSPAYLSVSSQLHLEALASGMSRVYSINPTFRAEKSMTSRHLSEFWMAEAEVAFIDRLEQNMEVCEQAVKSSIKKCLSRNGSDMMFFSKFYDTTLLERLHEYVNSPFHHLTYTESIEILKKAPVTFEHPVEWGLSLQSEHEKYLAAEHCKAPVFVRDYPIDLKPFYMKRNPDAATVACFDLLVPHIGELAGGSMREDDINILTDNIHKHNLDIASLKWYLELRQYGSFPHGGFGIGLDRLVQMISGMQSIRDVIPFPRYFSHCNY